MAEDYQFASVVDGLEGRFRFTPASIVTVSHVEPRISGRPAVAIIIPGGRILTQGDSVSLDKDGAKAFLRLFRDAASDAFGPGWETKP